MADAKAFRLSRTAKNQKDFKVEAMNNWKRGKKYAIVVCPIYQLPSKNSQIYQQAMVRDVCILSYSHLACILQFSEIYGKELAKNLLFDILKTVVLMNPTKDAIDYWTIINRTLVNYNNGITNIWSIEKAMVMEIIKYSKEEALTFLAKQREAILLMTKEQAIKALMSKLNIEGKEKVINSVSDNKLLNIA